MHHHVPQGGHRATGRRPGPGPSRAPGGSLPVPPTLIEFLAEDLAQVESFQGTRGLLRTLARAIRRLWQQRPDIPLIHTCHLDLSDSQIRNELLGKTGNTDLRSVLDSDVSKSADSAATGRTVAGDLDASNPHPDGHPVHEWTWRVVFLHSLVGRAGGLTDEKFGIEWLSAIYETAAPAIPPVTVRTALEQIPREANYLRGARRSPLCRHRAHAEQHHPPHREQHRRRTGPGAHRPGGAPTRADRPVRGARRHRRLRGDPGQRQAPPTRRALLPAP
ncbi:MAG: DUF499 domain-containing protein [Arhodomonas sp.]|nr:DUF499 domain-containing protein [Arhodomonas sp.]